MTATTARLSSLLALLSVTLLAWLTPWLLSDAHKPDNVLQVSFLAVGQGDAIYIETPDGVQALVDGGPDGMVLAKLAEHLSPFDTTLDLVVGTHPDLDHVAGLVDVLERYQVATIVTTEAEGASPAAKAWVQGVATEGANVQYARAGQTLQLGASTTLTILSPAYDPTELNSNAGSIVARLSYGDIDFMLTGDIPQGVESYLVGTQASALEAEVLKLSHHGSDTSSASDFLAAVDPLYAVVSAGANNRYNHPHPAVLERVAATQADVVSTQSGDIHFYTDGTQLWLAR